MSGNTGAAIGRLAFTFVGAYFGGTYGAALGSFLGGAIFPGAPIKGPQLTDQPITSSAQGVAISKFWGTIPAAGNVIWGTKLKKHKHTKKRGGIFGIGGQKIITYTYTMNFALALGCPIAGVLRIWENGKLVYDKRPQQDDEAEDDFAARIKAAEDYDEIITIYLGAEDQMPDPTIEADKGVGNVPAFRGISYIVYKDRDLTDLGGRVPAFQVEISTNLADPTYANYIVSPAWPSYPSADNSMPVRVTSTTVKFAEKEPAYSSPIFPVAVETMPVAWWLYSLDGQTLLSSGLSQYRLKNPPPIHRDGIAGILESISFSLVGYVMTAPIEVALGKMSYYYSVLPDLTSKAIWFVGGTEWADANLGLAYSDITSTHICNYFSGGIYISIDSVKNRLYRFGTDPTGRPSGVPLFYDYSTILFPTGDPTSVEMESLCPSGDRLYILCRVQQNHGFGGYLIWIQEIDPVTLAPIQNWNLTPFYASGDYIGLLVAGDLCAVASSVDGNIWLQIFRLNDDNTVTELVRDGTEFFGAPTSGARVFSDPNLRRMKVKDRWVRLPYGIDASPVILADIVSDICDECGLSVADYDVSELTETILGYRLDRVMSGADGIEPLRAFGNFDCAGGAPLRFPLRGKPSVATLDEDSIGAHLLGNEPPPLVELSRVEDLELPRLVRVNYLAPHAEYQIGQQKGSRLITKTVGADDIDLAIAMSDDKAAQIADTQLAQAWVGRETYKASAGPHMLALEPTDAVVLPVEGDSQRARIASISMGMPGILEIELVRDEASIYDTASVVGVPHPGTGSGGTVTHAGATQMVLIDGPAVQDIDNDAGVYVAARGGEGWTGAEIFESTDDGANFDSVLAIDTPSTMGFTEDALASGEWTTWDDVSTLVVQLDSGTLESLTEAAVYAGGNAAFIGSPDAWELIRFKTATLLSPGRYQLSGFLRGLRGTEWAIGLHAVADIFVMCNTLVRLPLETSAIGLALLYKAVTFGQSLEATGEYSLTPVGIALKPFAPCHVAGSFDATTGDLTISCYRRARLSAEWLNGTDVPLNEQFLRFEWDILATDGTTVRTLTSSTNRVTYTAAQILADFGSPQTSIDVAVYQISAVVGRGYRGRACT